ncbi:hypothetical protein KSP40_PGU000518 [Platanthera guangdongensis]|uniref:Peptidase C1A papain C-terminal domain-containing protein n=1 Tax=Platanthera guangdongensis TaxID=2320717 RepID=A0ABR2LTU4_9ASPA
MQHLVHCNKMSKCCRGGSYVGAFDLIQKNGTIFEVGYPYTAKVGKCGVADSAEAVVAVNGIVGIAVIGIAGVGWRRRHNVGVGGVCNLVLT